MSLRERAQRAIESRHVVWGTTLASFAESTVVPIPLEVVLIPIMQKNRQRIWLLATVTTLACLAGAVAFYYIGYFFYETAGQWLISTLSSQQEFQDVEKQLQDNGFWAVLLIGVAPLPFQMATLGAGFIKMNVAMFLLACTIARGIRYYGLALLVCWYGNKAEHYFHKHKWTVGLGTTAIVAGAWALSTFLF